MPNENINVDETNSYEIDKAELIKIVGDEKKIAAEAARIRKIRLEEMNKSFPIIRKILLESGGFKRKPKRLDSILNKIQQELPYTLENVSDVDVVVNEFKNSDDLMGELNKELSNRSVSLKNSVVKDRKDSNDKISKLFLNPTYKESVDKIIMVGEGMQQGRNIISTVTWDFDDKILADNPQLAKFTAFDREVILTAISEYVVHRTNLPMPYSTTPEAIYRAMVGDDGSNNKRKNPSQTMLDDIQESLKKASRCRIKIDMSDVCKAYGYSDSLPVIFEGYLLPINFLHGVKVNGKITTMVSILGTSPLYKAAEKKNGQILTYEKKSLDIPLNNSKDIIIIKNQLLRRILEVKKHCKDLMPVIILENFFHYLGFGDIDRRLKSRLLGYMEKMLDFWLEMDIIKSYCFYDCKGNEIKGASWLDVSQLQKDGAKTQVNKIEKFKRKSANGGLYSLKFTY